MKVIQLANDFKFHDKQMLREQHLLITNITAFFKFASGFVKWSESDAIKAIHAILVDIRG